MLLIAIMREHGRRGDEERRRQARDAAVERRAVEIFERYGCDWVEAWARALAERDRGDGAARRAHSGRPRRAPTRSAPGSITLSEQIGGARRPSSGAAAPGRTVAAAGVAPIAVHRKAAQTLAADEATVTERLRAAQQDPGTVLPAQLRAELAAALGVGLDALGAITVHAGPAAADAAQTIAARAYTIGRDIYFASGAYDPESDAGRRLIAHEVVHAAGQPAVTVEPGAIRISDPADAHERAADELAEAFVARTQGPGPAARDAAAMSAPRSGATLHRYATGEHVKFGNTGDLIGDEEITYTVKTGEGLDSIAARCHVSVEVIKERNKDKLKTFVIEGKKVEGFLAKEQIRIPTGRKEVKSSAGKSTAPGAATPQQTVTIKGITFSYGEVIALGDFYKSPEALLKADKAELLELQKLMQADAKSPGSVSQKQWNDATGRRAPDDQYVAQALNNSDHFAPSNPALASPSAKNTGKNHKAMWETHHQKALELAQQGKMNDALLYNGFGDHFLTDAFSAGHLINKDDVMAQFRGNVTDPKDTDKKKPKRDGFCLAVATEVFKDAKAAAYIARFEGKKYGFWWSINDPDRFSGVLEGVDDEMPNVLENAIALSVHDKLNHSDKVEVKNKNLTWKLSGDETLNGTSEAEARKAVAQSQVNVMNTRGQAGPLDLPGMFKNVWDFVPVLTTAGTAAVKQAVGKGTNPAEQDNIHEVASKVIENVELIMLKVVAKGFLRGPK